MWGVGRVGASPKMWERRGWRWVSARAKLGDAGQRGGEQQGRPEAGAMDVGSRPWLRESGHDPAVPNRGCGAAIGAGERQSIPCPPRSPPARGRGAGRDARSGPGRGAPCVLPRRAGGSGAARLGTERLGQPSAPPRHAMERSRAGREPQPQPQPQLAQGKAPRRGPAPAPAGAQAPSRTAGPRRSRGCRMRPWGRREPGRGGSGSRAGGGGGNAGAEPRGCGTRPRGMPAGMPRRPGPGDAAGPPAEPLGRQSGAGARGGGGGAGGGGGGGGDLHGRDKAPAWPLHLGVGRSRAAPGPAAARGCGGSCPWGALPGRPRHGGGVRGGGAGACLCPGSSPPAGGRCRPGPEPPPPSAAAGGPGGQGPAAAGGAVSPRPAGGCLPAPLVLWGVGGPGSAPLCRGHGHGPARRGGPGRAEVAAGGSRGAGVAPRRGDGGGGVGPGRASAGAAPG